MRDSRPATVMCVAALVVLSVGCTANSVEKPVTSRPTDPVGNRPEPVVGTWGISDEPEKPHYQFGPDRTYTGFDGCNSASDTWERRDSTIVLTAELTSTVACPEVTSPTHVRVADDRLFGFNADERLWVIARDKH